MNLPTLQNLILLPILVAVIACGGTTSEATSKSFDVVVRANSDDGLPMAGARFSIGDSTLGITDSNGAFTTTIRGEEGQTVEVAASCPDGYVALEKPTILRLTQVRRVDATGAQSLNVEATCTRKLRDVMLVVRANNGASVPVEVLGKTVGQTDANGIAHLALRLDRDERKLLVGLKTQGLPKLRPPNPSRVFELDGQDALVLLDQTFVEDKPKPVVRAKKPVKKEEPPKPTGPVHIE